MVASIGSTLSALNAFGTQMAVTANNIANVETEEFKKSRAVLEEGPNSEVQVEIEKIDTPGPIVTEVRDGEMIEKEMSNVDLAEEIPRTITAQRGYEANLTVIKTRDEMLGTLVDIVG
ncbi:flagellar basal body rod C-terminal domain-containing protein [Thermodesulfobacteriota bacterium]